LSRPGEEKEVAGHKATFLDAMKGLKIVKYRCPFDLCGLVVRVPGYRSRSGFDSRSYQIF
jgi:hypothetical protein